MGQSVPQSNNVQGLSMKNLKNNPTFWIFILVVLFVASLYTIRTMESLNPPKDHACVALKRMVSARVQAHPDSTGEFCVLVQFDKRQIRPITYNFKELK